MPPLVSVKKSCGTISYHNQNQIKTSRFLKMSEMSRCLPFFWRLALDFAFLVQLFSGLFFACSEAFSTPKDLNYLEQEISIINENYLPNLCGTYNTCGWTSLQKQIGQEIETAIKRIINSINFLAHRSIYRISSYSCRGNYSFLNS